MFNFTIETQQKTSKVFPSLSYSYYNDFTIHPPVLAYSKVPEDGALWLNFTKPT